jgi:hypothetical protein
MECGGGKYSPAEKKSSKFTEKKKEKGRFDVRRL